jgi:hypothetical protein
MAANKLADSDVHPAIEYKDLDNLKSSISISEFIAYVGVSPISCFFFRSPCSVSFFCFVVRLITLIHRPRIGVLLVQLRQSVNLGKK